MSVASKTGETGFSWRIIFFPYVLNPAENSYLTATNKKVQSKRARKNFDKALRTVHTPEKNIFIPFFLNADRLNFFS